MSENRKDEMTTNATEIIVSKYFNNLNDNLPNSPAVTDCDSGITGPASQDGLSVPHTPASFNGVVSVTTDKDTISPAPLTSTANTPLGDTEVCLEMQESLERNRRSALANKNEPDHNRRTNIFRFESTLYREENVNSAQKGAKKSRSQDQNISRLFYEEEASDSRTTGHAIDMYNLTSLKKLFRKHGIEEMYLSYSGRQFRPHLTSALVLLGFYKLLVLILLVVFLSSPGGHSRDFLLYKCISICVVLATTIAFLIGSRLLHIYTRWSSYMSVAFLVIYMIHCLVEPWIEAVCKQSMYNPAPNILHFIFTAFAMLPISTWTGIAASITAAVLSVVNQACIFVYAYKMIEPAELNRQPEKSVANQVISLGLLYLAAILVGAYLKIFCTEFTYRQTFYNTRKFIETELMTNIKNEINRSITEGLIQRILPDYLVRDVLQQMDAMKKFQINTPPRRNYGNFPRVGLPSNSSQISETETVKSSGSLVSETKLLKLNIQKHTGVTILFADIVEFCKLTTYLTPSQLVQTLHDLYSRFDQLSQIFNCQRTKLIGDCYKCVAGLNGCDRNSAVDAIWMGLHMVAEIDKVALSHCAPKLKMRIGVHSGFVFAGILGLKKWQFDVWSEDVQIANALETEGRPGFVHASQASIDQIPLGFFNLECVIRYRNKSGHAAQFLLSKSIRSYIVTSALGCDMAKMFLARAPIVKISCRIPDELRPSTFDETVVQLDDVESRHNTFRTSTGSLDQLRHISYSTGDVFSPSPFGTLSIKDELIAENGTCRSYLCNQPSGNPIAKFITNMREFSSQLHMSADDKAREIIQRLKDVYHLSATSHSPYDVNNKSENQSRIRLEEIQSEMTNVAMTFKNLRLERIYKRNKDNNFQLAVVVTYLTYLIMTVLIRLNELEGENKTVTTAIASVSTILLGFSVFFFTMCGFSNKLMSKMNLFLQSSFARSVAYTCVMAIIYCNCFMPFYLCSPLSEQGLKDAFKGSSLTNYTGCLLCDINDCTPNNMTRAEIRAKYSPIGNFEEAMRLNGIKGSCPNAYLFADLTILLVFVTAIFSRVPFLVRYLIIFIAYLVFLFYAFLIKSDAFTTYDLCAVQHYFWDTAYSIESKVYYAVFQMFFFLNLFVMCYQQEKNNRLDFLLRNGARRKEQELRRKVAQNSALLENILPNHVTQWYIRRSNKPSSASELYVESHDRVCILFAKITNYTFEGESAEVMRALNEITAAFDNLLELPEFSQVVEKIKINQTMFLYAAGFDCRFRHFDEAAVTLAEFAASLFEVLAKLNEQISYPYSMRVGMHCGSVVAGVIGSSMPLYDILGETVNLASRLECCETYDHRQLPDGNIHVSSALNKLYNDECGIPYRRKVTADIKGFGMRPVYIYAPEQIKIFMHNIRQEVNKN